MLLTLYYMVATWLQSWRLCTLRSKITSLHSHNASLVLYTQREPLLTADGTRDRNAQTVASPCCVNYLESHVGDLLSYSDNKRLVSVYPKQMLDVSTWIAVANVGRCSLPLELCGVARVTLSEMTRLHVLLEAQYSGALQMAHQIQVEEIGVARAWMADDSVSLLIETDVDQLSRICSHHLLNTLAFKYGLQLIRIQTVEAYGKPYTLINGDTIPVAWSSIKRGGRSKRQLTRSAWCSHLALLRQFTQLANEDPSHTRPLSLPTYRSVVLVPGSCEISLSLPTVVTIEEASDGEIVVQNSQSSIAVPLLNGGSTYNMDSEETRLDEGPICPRSGSVSSLASRGTNQVVTLDGSVSSLSAQPGSKQVSQLSLSIGSASRFSTDALLAVTPLSGSSLGTVSTASMRTPRHTPLPPNTPMKPPNVIVFSESSTLTESVKAALDRTLLPNSYTIYSLSLSDMLRSPWLDQTCLVVVCGSVPPSLAPRLASYLLHNGGRLLCLCSDLLTTLLPNFTTVEVRPDEMVTFSYATWHHVPMMHHVFCYQPSGKPKTFFQDGTSETQEVPSSVEVLDADSKPHTLLVSVLAAEETWQTPCLLLAVDTASTGKVVFSQVHLETDPSQYESDEAKGPQLKTNDRQRLEILSHLLSRHLGMQCGSASPIPTYTNAYFLGNHELKNELLVALADKLRDGNVLDLNDLSVKFCGKGAMPPAPSEYLMPLLMFACPDDFSTVEYFENLGTVHIGRLVIYSSVMKTSMELVRGPKLSHGMAVIPRLQTHGIGRGGNTWLSPEGCAMFSLQLHFSLCSELGAKVSLLQHVTSLAIVSALCSQPGLEDLDIGLKWPNDIYVGGKTKVGGNLVMSSIDGTTAICSIGVGVNLNNQLPTVSVNEMIRQLGKETGRKLNPISYEKYFAICFTELERLIDLIQSGHVDQVIDLYYKYWLHSESAVHVMGSDGSSQDVTVVGIDSYGFLRVRNSQNAVFTVHPDGNSFEMLTGLIAPKLKN